MRPGRRNRRTNTRTAGGIFAGLVLIFGVLGVIGVAASPVAAVSEHTGEQVNAHVSKSGEAGSGVGEGPGTIQIGSSAHLSIEEAVYQQAVADSVARLYLAVFDRAPDNAGSAYWVAEYLRGVSLRDIGAAFMVSDEWIDRYGAVDDARFVDLLYGNVLHRAADVDGRNYWLTSVGGGTARAEVLLQFSESTEFVALTGTADPLPPYPPIPADSGAGRRIVYGNTAQRVWLIEADGTVFDSYLVSGRRDRPAAGTYSVYSKSEKAWAGHDGITMDHMVRFARGRSLAIGFHSIPTYADGTPMQTLDQLGTYRSAGCVRQEAGKAAQLFQWADIGTTVVVLD